MDARTLYVSRREARAAELARSDAHFRLIGTSRFVCVIVAAVAVGAMVFAHGPDALWWLALVALVAFVVLVVLHGRVETRRIRARAAVAYFDHGLARLGGDWSASRTGEAFAEPDHPYAGDLDIFGRSSLFQRVSVAQTRFGEQTLAAWLKAPAADPETVAARQQAARELATMPDFRERLAVLGATLGGGQDPGALLDWIDKGSAPVPSAGWRVAPFVLPLVVALPPALGPHFGLSATVCAIPYALSVAVALVLRGRTAPVLSMVSSNESSLAAYAELFELIEQAEMKAPMLASIRARLRSDGLPATREMRSLSTILGFADALGNEVFRLLVAPIFGFEPRAVLALESWRVRNASGVRGWLTALGELEALASFGCVAFEDPGLCWPEISSAPCFAATALAHPLIAASKRVPNDVTLPAAGHALVVTGSNMSGKSTLMRAMGANAVLALAGAPTCAASLKLGMLRVATSMRVSDSLADSTSHFYAELKKLKLVLDLAKPGPGVFFLLDEILHGTNSRERLIGARAIVRSLLERGGLGAVSTHDLGLSDLEDELPRQVRNVHFQEQIAADVMTFDYSLRPGVVQSSNALRLMTIVGLDIGEV